MVIDGWNTSSNMYRSLIDGRPTKIKMKAGTTVQNNSRGWDSRVCLSISLPETMEYILNPTILVIKIRMVMAWSWNKMSCSIRGLEEF
jgi:hypothetical protein